jgi:cell division protein FtsI/penicillin-binding protein 2
MDRAERSTWRYNVVFGLMALALCALCARVVVLMRADRQAASAAIEVQQRMFIPVPGKPGSIYASTRGRSVLVAGSKQVPLVYADPKLIGDSELADLCLSLGKALDMDPQAVQRIIVERRDRQYAVIKRDVTSAQLAALKAARIPVETARGVKMQPLPGVGVSYDWRREYPCAQIGATVVGYMQGCGEPGAGLELAVQHRTAATDGVNVMLATAGRQPIWPLPEKSRPPVDGGHVVLTLDMEVQRFLQEGLEAALAKYGMPGRTWAAGVVLEPQTGRVLAMASAPTFDPNTFARNPDLQTVREALERANNHVITVPFEPGSAFKPVMAAAAVEAGVVNWHTQIDCEGGVWRAPNGGVISDHGSSYGWMTVIEIIAKSSNIGMGKIGLLMGNQRQHDALVAMGFGSPTGIPLPGETRGILRPLPKWDTYSTPRVPFGQEISCSAIQLAMAYGALTNGGELLEPRLIERLTDGAGNTIWQDRRRVVRRVLSPQTSAGVVAAMQQVVENGTGKACKLSRWTSFGKTGTAQIAAGGRYVDGAFTGTFVGGAPVGKPRLLVSIHVYWPDHAKGHYGATVAAPFVKEVLEKSLTYLEEPPDKDLNIASAAAGAGGPAPHD